MKMRNNLLKLTIELKNPNIYTYYKIKSFIKILDDRFVKYNMVVKDCSCDISKNTDNKICKKNETEFNGSDNIIKYIDVKMNKFYDNLDHLINK
jgi:hypothetical protein